MEATFLNGDLESSFTLDVFKSFLWIDRFAEYGDFEITVSPTENILSGLLISKYINVKESDHAMVIEDISIESDPEDR